MQLGMIGLGRMGANMVRRLMQHGHECVVFDANAEAVAAVTAAGAQGTSSVEEFIARLKPPRAVWIMLPVPVVEGVVKTVAAHLQKGDILIDGGNSPFENAIRRAGELRPKGIHFVDVGTSGGVWGLERGYCLMIGGSPEAVQRLEPIFRDLAPGMGDVEPVAGRDANAPASKGYLHCGPPGAGHFVKMVHNGIEYGMMAAYAEGFNLLRHAGAGLREGPGAPDSPERYQYDFDLGAIAELWRRGSVVTSWLLDLTAASLADDPQLKGFHGPSLGFRRGPLDAQGGDRHRRAGAGPVGSPVFPVRVARGSRICQPAAVRHALPVWRPPGNEQAMTERSDAVVLLGATGDLAHRKIYPALKAMVKRGTLDVPVVGVARSGWNLEQFQAAGAGQPRQAHEGRDVAAGREADLAAALRGW